MPVSPGERILVARLDSDGDVLLAGPAVRAAAEAGRVTVLCGPDGRQAAELLPGVCGLLVWRCPWIDPEPAAVDPIDIHLLVRRLADLHLTTALVLTSFHQSPLPLAMLLRLAGVPRIAGISTDYPGSLLDVRLRPGVDIGEDIPEAERALAVARAAGFDLPAGDDGRLGVTEPPLTDDLTGGGEYVVVHPGASVQARTLPAERFAGLVAELVTRGRRVVVTGGPEERHLTARVAGCQALDLGGRTDFARLAGVLAAAYAVVVGNTGPAHLAAAVGTPIVSLFAPVVEATKWAPYGVPCVVLGDQSAACAGSRARTCPVPGHPCLMSVGVGDVADALDEVLSTRQACDPIPVVRSGRRY